MKPLLLFWAMTLALVAQDESISLTEWRAKAGDDLAWARADFDDGAWGTPQKLSGEGSLAGLGQNDITVVTVRRRRG